ncbi:MAG TPA: TetR/AcrR family transcriptional regulator [Pseudomonadales bacterium]|nr:TetR/AcrR family transcriptional regulator [Pseudomonadales bacterium]
MTAALELFMAQGYQKTSIARIETEAGLVPRAGAFYRHFESKQSLLLEVARAHVSETPESFGLDGLADFGDTRAELIAIARRYEEAMIRQKPYARLIEEIRLLEFGADLQEELDAGMMIGLAKWVRAKPAAKGLSTKRVSALVISVFGGWLFYLSMVRRGANVEPLRDTLLDDWATLWAKVLDKAP